jgi:hypothetical protein
MSKLAGEFVKAFVGFRAAVAEEHFAGSERSDDRFRETPLRLVVIKVGNVDEFLRLLNKRVGDFRIRVAKATDRNAAAEIEVSLAGNVIDVTARAMADGEIEAGVGGHHVFCVEFLDRGDIVAYDGRWFGYDLSH